MEKKMRDASSTVPVPEKEKSLEESKDAIGPRTVQGPMELIELPTISLWQPWASWVAWGWKPVETRRHARFASLVGKRIGIHAAKKWDHDALKIAERYLGPSQVKQTVSLGYEAPQGILCTVFVWAHEHCEMSDAENALIECETSRYGLFLEAINKIQPPFRCKGRQGIWRETCPISVHGDYALCRGVPSAEQEGNASV